MATEIFDIDKLIDGMMADNERRRRELSERMAEIAAVRNGIARDADITRTQAELDRRNQNGEK